MKQSNFIPLSLYIHLPWCQFKCPFCDFNAHTYTKNTNKNLYIQQLKQDLISFQNYSVGRKIHSIYFGGGTPSLFDENEIEQILNEVSHHYQLEADCEITLEANPETLNQSKIESYIQAGINRMSVGIQSFNQHSLSTLQRLHTVQTNLEVAEYLQNSRLESYNLDLMYATPNQTIQDAIEDIKQLIKINPPHLSYYKLSIEPNSKYYSQTPNLPQDEWVEELESIAIPIISQHYQQYEIAAFTKNKKFKCKHNLNYWQFGDYIGIGAGSHGKLTNIEDQSIFRTQITRHPKDYQKRLSPRFKKELLNQKQVVFEYLLNHLRLLQPIKLKQFEKISLQKAENLIFCLKNSNFSEFFDFTKTQIKLTQQGFNYIDDILVDILT